MITRTRTRKRAHMDMHAPIFLKKQQQKHLQLLSFEKIKKPVPYSVYGALVLPKQFLSKGCTGWFAIAFPALIACALNLSF